MTFPENKVLELADPVPTGTQAQTEVRQMTGKGYDFIRGAGAGYTAVLEGSVAGRNWTTIVSLAASAQGVIPVQYNLVRVNCSILGVLGTGPRLVVSGKIV